jgi:hypothetical protein
LLEKNHGQFSLNLRDYVEVLLRTIVVSGPWNSPKSNEIADFILSNGKQMGELQSLLDGPWNESKGQNVRIFIMSLINKRL